MKFDWSKFTEADFNQYCDWVKNGTCLADEYIGTIHVGELAFDLVTREFATGTLTLTFDCFVGGRDTGYGYSACPMVDSGKYQTINQVPDEERYPYDEGDGGYFLRNDTCTDLTYDEFVELVEAVFVVFIRQNQDEELITKANAPLIKF